MMKVKLLTGRCGDDDKGRQFIQNPGDEIEVNASLGQRMIEAGQAIYVSGEKPGKTKGKPEADSEDTVKTESENEVKTTDSDDPPAKKGGRKKRVAT